jgi:hypothetical protein
MPKICIVATCFDRQFQLNKTLDSISKSSSGKIRLMK